MAMRIVKERVCDLCASAKGVKQYRVGIVGNGKGVTPDLCETCGKPLDDLLDRAKHVRNSPLRKPREVLTPEEVKKRRRK